MKLVPITAIPTIADHDNICSMMMTAISHRVPDRRDLLVLDRSVSERTMIGLNNPTKVYVGITLGMKAVYTGTHWDNV